MEKNKITRISDFNTIQLKLASTDNILEWSHGEVTRPETINYRTQRFEKDGLFCEKIFGPAKDWECYCGKYKRIRYKGIICDKCGVEITRSIVRRERMGHIQLAVPVSHIWFLRGVPSKVGLVLNLSPQQLENVIYFAGYIVTNVDQAARKESLKSLKKEYDTKIKGIKDKKEIKKIDEAFRATKTQLRGLAERQILSEVEYYNLARKFGQVFEAEIGAEAINKLLGEINLRQEISAIKKNLNKERSGDKKKMFKRLKLMSGMLKVGIKPEWMMLKAIPVIPPDLRPMVQLDGGRFATSDLNDLYRRIINRNNRLKKLIELGAPEVIQRNEKRMLQEAVDALLDNSARRNQTKVAASTGQRRPLKSVADMLKGKQGRFRQNLLGKRVDYSGRSVIVIGPSLGISQCGIPKKMALELFKPFIINKLIEKEYAHNVRIAGRMVDGETEEAYEMLEEIISSQYVLLNRAPTLHRLSVQAFQPKLIEGKSIQIHPLVCSAFNADFDGDQMAVHVPLTKKAREECADIMLSSKNLLKPSSGDPIIVPSQDIVLGVYYMTRIKDNSKGKGKGMIFGSIDEIISAFQAEVIDLKMKITLYYKGEKLETSAGRALINDILPEDMRYLNKELNKTGLKELVSNFLLNKGNEKTVEFLDKLKNLGFKYSTQSGISLGINDLHIPESKKEIMDRADEEVKNINNQYDSGLLTDEERKAHVIDIWNNVKNEVAEKVKEAIVVDSSIYSMIDSKARGSDAVVVQMAGMKGLVAGPTGETIELPIKGSLKEGFNVLEYFISTHGARKGMADTALRTATAGYLTRRLVDVSQDVIIMESDCGDTEGSYLYKKDSDDIGLSFSSRAEGRVLLEDVTKKGSKKIIAKKGELINHEQAKKIEEADVEKIRIRSLVTCKTPRGICQSCYGKDLGRNRLVKIGEAVGIVAAQAIGEPGTQLTMRTFHIGGVAGTDITQGLPRVDEIFETRPPKGEAIMAEFDGQVVSIEENKKQRIVEVKKSLTGGKTRESDEVVKKYSVPAVMNLQVKKGDLVTQGQVLSEGHLDLKNLFKISGRDVLQRYIINEVQEIYQTQGEGINDKHLEIIIRQMLSRVKVLEAGDTDLLVGDIIEKEKFEESNRLMGEKGGEKAKGEQLVLGITKVALSTDSFLSAASFQETAKVLINAAIEGSEDHLRGLKENVIIGKLIPAGTGYKEKESKEKVKAK
jgi:DNA-directed RNA polymerase subunit beta'